MLSTSNYLYFFLKYQYLLKYVFFNIFFRAEVTRLEKQTANERDKYQRNTRSLQGGLSMPPLLDVEYEVKHFM